MRKVRYQKPADFEWRDLTFLNSLVFQWASQIVILNDFQRISMNLNENPRKILKASKIVLSFQLNSSGLEREVVINYWLIFIEDFYVWGPLRLKTFEAQPLKISTSEVQR